MQNKNHFIFPYEGNKRNEIKEINQVINNYDVEYIVEPYCGSCAFSYFLSIKYPKKYKYILNDNNDNLINLLKLLSNNNDLEEFEKKINDICGDPNFNKEIYNKLDGLEGYYIKCKIMCIRAGLFPLKYKYKYINIKDCNFIKFLLNENILLLNKDGLEIYQEYKNKDSIIFLDPPYLLSDNSLYKNPALKIYEYLYNNKIIKEKATIIISGEYNFLIKILFKKYKYHLYNKCNIGNKRKFKQHLIICNKITKEDATTTTPEIL
jgi:hypothetical protein